MIFNIGENSTLDVLRMLMHRAVAQQQTEQPKKPIKNHVAHTNTSPFVITPSVEAVNVSDTLLKNDDSLSNDGPRRLHVTNLPFKIKDNELQAMFEIYGAVLDAEIIYNERGSKGFGFVTMETAEAAKQAKEALHKKEIDGRKIEVNNATPRAIQSKSGVRLNNQNTVSPPQSSQTNSIFKTAQGSRVQNFSGPWNPASFNCLTTSPVQINPVGFTIPPLQIPPVNLAAISNTAIPGMACIPTPEQYAQYYNYMSAHARAARSNGGSLGSHRYQPY